MQAYEHVQKAATQQYAILFPHAALLNSCGGWQVDRADKGVATSRLMAQEAVIINQCAHPNVMPLAFVGVQPPPQLCTPADPTRVVYLGFPWADLSLEKRLGSAPLPLPPPPLSGSCCVWFVFILSSSCLLFAMVCMLCQVHAVLAVCCLLHDCLSTLSYHDAAALMLP